jgi:predicted ATP-dependent endonuclease of OLD family
MLLTKIEITDFLSIKGSMLLDFDRKVTILLGSNDHGKSNVLKAVEHLNPSQPITEDEANWDASGTPSLSFSFSLTLRERNEWKTIVDAVSRRRVELLLKEVGGEAQVQDASTDSNESAPDAEKAAAPGWPTKKSPANDTEGTEDPEDTEDAPEHPEISLPDSALNSKVEGLILTRSGVGTELTFEGIHLSRLPGDMATFIRERLPRVEMFRALTGTLQDSATSSTINTDEFEFLQGVFFYAGLDPKNCTFVFTQDDKTIRALDKASKQLDASLRSLWGQGTELHFELRHKGNAIEFLADDPAIKSRKARMSKRSSGVTQFFRVSMVLYARRKKAPANSYVYLFDEPGVLLHPQGQRDLLQVFEQLAEENQIVYATHSLFLLNQNFPERHRLIFKDEEGTKVDQKPYRQNWKLATDALGVYLTSNVLFSSRILLVEGDSDPIYLYELFRQLNQSGELDVDLNTLGIMSFSDYQNLRFLIQIFRREGQKAALFVVTDGDVMGKDILKKIAPLAKRLDVSTFRLPEWRSIEDYCLFEDAFLDAVQATLENACEAEEKDVPENLHESIRKSWADHKATMEKPEKRVRAEKVDKDEKDDKSEKKTGGKWFKELSEELIKDEASKVVLARTYAERCRTLTGMAPNKDKVKDAKVLCREIADKLNLPPVKATKAIEL